MNATAVCDSTPRQWLFYTSGECCTSNEEPFQLADWVGSMCNGSEWRQNFSHFDGMAREDWGEWIIPWNWTVRKENTSTQILPPAECSSASRYLGLFGIEHFFYLFAAVGFGALRLAWTSLEERKGVPLFNLLWVKTKRLWKCVFCGNPTQVPDPKASSGADWIIPVSFGIFMAAVQVAFNLASAALIKSRPGYKHVPLGQLALLFCCRPRIAWLACVVGLFPKEWTKKCFRIKGDKSQEAAKMILSGVAVSSTISEGIMQILGVYYMGITANIGRERGFYLVHRLRPFWKGRDARHMYLGALFWLIACILIIPVWFVLALFHAFLLHWIRKWMKSHSVKENEEGSEANQPPKWAIWTLRVLGEPNLPIREQEGDNIREVEGDNIRTKEEGDNIAVQETGDNIPSTNVDDEVDNIRVVGNQTAGERIPIPGDYGDNIPIIQSYPQVQLTVSETAPSETAPSNTDDTHDSQMRGALLASRPHPSDLEKQQPTPTQGYQDENEALVKKDSLQSIETQPKRLPWAFEEWQPWIIWIGVLIGLIAYAAQWLFWDGFVKAAGDRFCPPSLWKTGAMWWAGTVLSILAAILSG